MANHRMFSYRIANSAKFLQMPAETQLLYFHLVLRADDDGVVESYPIVKMLGIPSDNFKVLEAKGYIKQINEDQVILIIDWLEHNKIRADRKVNSFYKPLLDKIGVKTITPKPRVDVKNNSKRLAGQSTDRQRTAQVKLSKVKLSKVKLSKVKREKEKKSQKKEKKLVVEKELTPKEKMIKFINKPEIAISPLVERGIDEDLVKSEVLKFRSYWTEPTKSGKKQRWELQPTFDVGRRLATWFNNINKYSSQQRGGVAVK